MKSIRPIYFLIILSIVSCAEDDLLNWDESYGGVPHMNVYIDRDNYAILLSNKNINVEVPCCVYYRNNEYKGMIRAAGAGSRYWPRWSYKVNLDNGYIEGLDHFNLSSQLLDKTMMKTNIALVMYSRIGMETSYNTHIFLRINNEEAGLFQLIERIDEDFFAKREINICEMYKFGFKSLFTFTKKDFYPDVTVKKTIPKDNNYRSLIELISMSDTCKLENVFEQLGGFLDIERYLKYHAMTSIMNNWDGFTNNIHLWRDTRGDAFRVSPWDFDKCFDETQGVGLAGRNGLANKLFRNDSAFNMYKDIVKYQLENIYTEEEIFGLIDSLALSIEEAYNRDKYLGDGRYNFKTEIEYLKEYIKERREYFIENIDSFTKESFFE